MYISVLDQYLIFEDYKNYRVKLENVSRNICKTALIRDICLLFDKKKRTPCIYLNTSTS